MAAMGGLSLTLSLWRFYIFVNSSETAKPISSKFWWNSPLVVLFENCVRLCQAASNMVAMARHSLTLDPMGILTFSLTTLRKLSQFEPNFTKMFLTWPPLKIMFGFSECHQTWPPWADLVNIEPMEILHFRQLV